MWEHLEGADYFTGRRAPTTTNAQRNCRVSESFKNTSFAVSAASATGTAWNDFTISDRHFVLLSECDTTSQFQGPFTAQEVEFIDKKIDDGDATTGEILGIAHATGSGCSLYTASSLSAYDLDDPDTGCSIFMPLRAWD